MNMKRSASPRTPNEPVLPGATPEQMLKGALGLQALTGKVGVTATTVSEITIQQGGGYDRSSRSLVLGLIHGLSSTDPDIGAQAAALATALGLNVEQMSDNLLRQQAAWDGCQDLMAITSGVRQGRLVVDGTRRLARSMVEADVAKKRASLPPAAQAVLDDDFRDYSAAVAEDLAGKLATRALTREITTSANQRIGEFQDRRQLVDTLDQLGADAELPWDVMAKAGATLDELTGQDQGPAAPVGSETGPSSIDGATLPGQRAGTAGAGKTGNRRDSTRG
jgi:hypothetical protein